MKKILVLMIALFVLSVNAESGETMVIEDEVRKIVSEDSSDKIMFQMHAGVYFVRKSKKQAEIKKALLESQKSKKKVQVKVDPETLEIEEIVTSK